MARGIDAQDGYLEALVKNMPSETVAGYLATLGMISGMGGDKGPPSWALWLFWGVFLVATPLYLWFARPKEEKETNPDNTPNAPAYRPWWQIWIFSPIAFFVWSMTAGGAWEGIKSAPMVGGILVVLLSVVVFPLASMGIAKATS